LADRNTLDDVAVTIVRRFPLRTSLGSSHMNRLQALARPQSFAATPAIKVEAGVFSPSRVDQPCAIFAPLHYEPNYAYPMLVWLHGPGDDENQLKRIMPLVSLRNYVGLSIRGTMAMPSQGRKQGYTWSGSVGHIAEAEQRLFDAIELARSRFHVAPGRIFLGGYDAGGTMAFRLALRHPRSFGGVLSIGGEFPRGDTPLRWLEDVRQLPVFMAYGRDSTSFNEAKVCEALRLFHVARMKVNLRQYPCPQQLTTVMLEDMDRWIMEQVTGVASTVDC